MSTKKALFFYLVVSIIFVSLGLSSFFSHDDLIMTVLYGILSIVPICGVCFMYKEYRKEKKEEKQKEEKKGTTIKQLYFEDWDQNGLEGYDDYCSKNNRTVPRS